MSFWKSRSYLSGGQSSTTNNDDDGQQYCESSGGKKRPSSRLKKSSKQTDGDATGDDYPNYTAPSNDAADDNRYTRKTSNDYGGGGAYNGSVVGAPYYGGYGNSSSYNGSGNNYSPYNGGGGGEGGYASYNLPASYLAPQDGRRSPMIIQTKEVNVYGALPGYDNDSYNDQRRRGGGGGGGFFGPALHAVGHFVDRKFGLHDRD